MRSVERLPLADDSKVGLLVSMPSFLKTSGEASSSFVATKAFTVFPANGEAGKPAHQGVTLLFEAEHGTLVSIADAHTVTATRTAAASAVATRAVARDGPCSLALLGSGTQAVAHFEAMRCVRELCEVHIWSRTPANAETLAAELQHRAGAALPVHVHYTVAEAVLNADVICTLTGNRAIDAPLLTASMVRPGTHINAVGACQPAYRELDASLVLGARLFVDTRAACAPSRVHCGFIPRTHTQQHTP